MVARSYTSPVDELAAKLIAYERRIASLERAFGGVSQVERFAMNEAYFAAVGSASSTVSASYVNVGTSPSFSVPFTKMRADTVLVVSLNISHYVTGTAGLTDWAVQAQGVDHFVLKTFHNNLGIHQGWSGVRAIAGLTAGTFNVILRWKTSGGTVSTNVDSNDSLSIHLREVLR